MGRARSGDGGTVRRGEDLIAGGFRNGVLSGFGFPVWVLGCGGRVVGCGGRVVGFVLIL
jgi:hypothetical protein